MPYALMYSRMTRVKRERLILSECVLHVRSTLDDLLPLVPADLTTCQPHIVELQNSFLEACSSLEEGRTFLIRMVSERIQQGKSINLAKRMEKLLIAANQENES